MPIEKYPIVIRYAEPTHTDTIFAEFSNNLKVDLTLAKELVAIRLNFTNNGKHFVVFDMSNVKEVTPEAKLFMQQPDTGLKNILGAAFIASNPVAALIANIFIKTPKNFESKFFSNKKDAMSWIAECRQRFARESMLKNQN